MIGKSFCGQFHCGFPPGSTGSLVSKIVEGLAGGRGSLSRAGLARWRGGGSVWGWLPSWLPSSTTAGVQALWALSGPLG